MATGRPKIELSPGTVFGKWTVLGEDPVRKNLAVAYFVKCECGFESSIAGYSLTRGRTLSCKSCAKMGTNANYGRIEHISSSYMTSLVRHSTRKSRQLEVTVSMQDLEDQWNLQEGKCALTGWPLTLTISERRNGRGTASIDRINPDLGYTPDNIQWVHKDVNVSKWNLEESRYFEICEAVFRHKDQTKKLREGRRPWLQS